MIRKILLIACAAALAACGSSDSPPPSEEHAAAKEHADDAAPDHAEIPPEAARAAGIVVESAGPVQLRETLALHGTIHANAERVRSVTARFPGVVRSLEKRVGDPVRAGEVLATVESNESLQSYQIAAPIAGIVTARNVNPGETAGEAPVFVITDLSTVWAELSVFPRDAGKVRNGQTVVVSMLDGAVRAEGRIVHVSPVGAATSQSLNVRVLLDNAGRAWTPGLYVTGNVVLGESSVPVAVKSAALQTLEGEVVVFVATDDGFEPRPVETGRADARWTEVVRGLQGGERYVSAGSFVVKAELAKSEAGHEH